MIFKNLPKTSVLSKSSLMPPKTRGLPFVGSIPGAIRHKTEFFLKAREELGDIYTFDGGFIKVVIINHPRLAQYIFRDAARNYTKSGVIWDVVRTFVGNGLVVSQGDFWLRQRRMMSPHFHRRRLRSITKLMVDAIEESMAFLEAPAQSPKPYNMLDAFTQITMKVIVKTLMGTGLSPQEVVDMGVALAYVLDYMLPGVMNTFVPNWLPMPGKKRNREELERVNRIIYSVIDRRRKQGLEGDDLLAMFLDMVDDETGDRMTDLQLRDELANFFLAGYETSATNLAWAYYYLTRNPDKLAKLREEVDQVLGDRKPTFDDVPKLQYTKMVIQESLRINPAAWFLPRAAVEDDEIDGYYIPAGTVIINMLYTIHHHPDVWENPEEFIPERFEPEEEANRHQFAWIPFGAGPRMCIGRDFAIMEAQLILAMIVQRYNISAVPGHVATSDFLSTLKPKNGVMVYVEKR